MGRMRLMARGRHPVVRAKFRSPATAAHDQVRSIGRFHPRPEAARAKDWLRTDGIVHQDGPKRNGLGEAGEILHGPEEGPDHLGIGISDGLIKPRTPSFEGSVAGKRGRAAS